MATTLLCFCANGDSIYVWSCDGAIRKFGQNGLELPFTSTNLSGWNGSVGLALDNAGNLYAGCPGDSEIHKFLASGSGESVVGGLDSVSALGFDNKGSLYATSPNYYTLAKLNYATNSFFPLGFWGADYFGAATNSTQMNLGYPISVAFDKAGNIYVPNCPNSFSFAKFDNTIQKFSADLVFLENVATNLNGPWGLAFDKSGNLFVANSGTNGNLSNTILKFTPDGVSSIFASVTNGLNSPKGLAFDSGGNLYVANGGDGAILKFTPDGVGSVFESTPGDCPTSLVIFPGLNVWSATPIELHAEIMADNSFRFIFASTPGLSFTALSTTNLSLATWLPVGNVGESSPGSGLYQFIDPQAKAIPQIYYRIISQ